MTYEVELKYRITDGNINDRLRILKGVFLNREDQVDTYLNGINRNFIETDEALRVRVINNGKKAEVTYKGTIIGTQSKTREEINVGITDPEELIALFEKIGFHKSVILHKVRENWSVGKYNIAVDKVDKLGNFIELETFTKEQDCIPAKINELKALAIQLGFDPENDIRRGYLDLIQDYLD